MIRSKRVQEDFEEKDDSSKVVDDVFTERHQAPEKVKVPIDRNPMPQNEGYKKNEILTSPQVSYLSLIELRMTIEMCNLRDFLRL